MSNDPWVQFENDWVFEVFVDTKEKAGFADAFYKGTDATDEMKTHTMGLATKMLDTLEARFADGRKYVGGEQLTAADFYLVGAHVGFLANPNGKNPEFSAAVTEEFNKRTNVKRIVDQVRSEKGLNEYIAALEEKKWTL